MKNKKPKGKYANFFGLVAAVLAALFIRSVAFEPYNIPSSSMVPTLLVGDYLFISKYPYGFSKHSFPLSVPFIPTGRLFDAPPKQGDIVIFKVPTDNKTDYIKRVIGLPGDKVQMINGRLYINDKMVEREFVKKEKWETEHGLMHYTRYIETLPNGLKHSIYELTDDTISDNTVAIVIPENHFFMMGDNRDNSMDSRFFGEVPAENLEGRAEFIFYSNNGKGWFIEFWKWADSLRFDRFFTGIH